MEPAKKRRRRKSEWVSNLKTYAPPGTPTVSTEPAPAAIRLISYSPDSFLDRPIADVREIEAHCGKQPVTWVNVDGLSDLPATRALGQMFGLHGLALEDLLHPNQRPKVDEYASFLLVIAKMLDRQSGRLGTEQLGLIVGRDYVLTFQERPGDCLDAIRLRAKEHRGRVRDAGADYLAYAIIDAVVDEYFPVLEQIGDRLEQLEDEVLAKPQPGTARRVHAIRRELLVLRRAAWPLREALNELARGSSPLITPETRIYVRDCYDHCVQVLDLIELYREMCTGLMEMYLTSISHRMNEVMRLLTIISTIFIPLTFIVGVYGMNFEHMPELHAWWGYPTVVAVMTTLAGGMVWYFWRRGWLGRAESIAPDEPGE